MKTLIILSLITFAIPLQAQEHQNGIGLNLGYTGDFGLEGTLSYEKFVGLRHLIRASTGLRSRNAYTLGLSYQYALINNEDFQILTGVGIERLSQSGTLFNLDRRLNRIYANLPIDFRYRISSAFWLNAGISPELRTLSGSKTSFEQYNLNMRLGFVYRF